MESQGCTSGNIATAAIGSREENTQVFGVPHKHGKDCFSIRLRNCIETELELMCVISRSSSRYLSTKIGSVD